MHRFAISKVVGYYHKLHLSRIKLHDEADNQSTRFDERPIDVYINHMRFRFAPFVYALIS